MPLDPQAKAFLEKLSAAGFPKLEDLTLDQIRALSIPIAGKLEPIARVEDRTVPGVDGNEIPVRLYWPDGWTEASDPLPALVLLHGGGWVMGTLDLYDSLAHSLANAGMCVVASVDYRLAPEHRFPAAVEDSHSATVWVNEQAESLGIDPQRMLVGGDSAGGNLAAGVAIMARDRASVKLAGQVLVYPIADCDFDNESYCENAEGYFLTRESMRWFWNQYVPDKSQRHNPLASPLRAESLAGLPSAWVMTAGYDPLRDEGEALATRLAADGVPTQLQKFDSQIHGFLRRTDLYDEAWRAIRLIGEFVASTPPVAD